MKKQSNTLFLAQSAMIAAIYVVLTVILAPFSYGEVQVRVSEALTILPVFTPAAIPGLFVGCLISNILGGCILPDIIFGSIATLLGACFTYLLRNRNKFLAPLPPIIFQYPDRSLCSALRLSGTASDSVPDGYGRYRRSDFLWNPGHDCVYNS